MPFNKLGIVILMQGLGRMQEYLIKATPKQERDELESILKDPLYLSIIHQELRNLMNLKQPIRTQEPQEVPPLLSTPQDLNELICGIREMQLKGLDDSLIQALVDTTQQFLRQAASEPTVTRPT